MRRIIERIKKLLRLSRSTNQHEAQLAMQRAVELAAKHRVSIAAIDPDDDARVVTHKRRPEPRLAFEKKRAAGIVQAFFDVTVIRFPDHLKIVGYAPDIEIAEYAYEFLVAACRCCLARYRRELADDGKKLTRTRRYNFIDGFMRGIADSLSKLTEFKDGGNTYALVLSTRGLQARNQYVATRWSLGRTRNPKFRTTNEALVSGWLQGKQTRIHRPVGETDDRSKPRGLCA